MGKSIFSCNNGSVNTSSDGISGDCSARKNAQRYDLSRIGMLQLSENRCLYGPLAYRDNSQLSVSLCVFRAPLHWEHANMTVHHKIYTITFRYVTTTQTGFPAVLDLASFIPAIIASCVSFFNF
jgi:hypothetical protein